MGVPRFSWFSRSGLQDHWQWKGHLSQRILQRWSSTRHRGVMAERVGFEPTLPFRVNTLSKRAPSATRPSLRFLDLTEFLQIIVHTLARNLFDLNFSRSSANFLPLPITSVPILRLQSDSQPAPVHDGKSERVKEPGPIVDLVRQCRHHNKNRMRSCDRLSCF